MPDATTRPRLAPSGAPRPPVRMIHLGPGAFARAFVVPWVEQAGGWGITGISLRAAATRDALRCQDYVYTAVETGPDGAIPRQIEALRDILVAPEDSAAVLAAMADPDIRIVSLTITEKGYCHDPATGRLNPGHPDIVHDIASDLPRSAPGVLVCALALRRAAGTPPFTVLSCDNLPGNGAVTRGVVLAFARLVDPALADWIAAEVRFPSTMIDRIVPATTPDDVDQISALLDGQDESPIKHEPFRQWVIEDDFPTGRPDLARHGVQMVADVAPFEAMKLRMLNGTHSALAYLGYLAGHMTVADAVADPALAHFIRHLWHHEIIPTLTAPPDTSLPDYADALMTRFANPAIRHSTWQIAMDGSQKLPQRILGTLADRRDAGHDAPGLMLVVAGWMRYVSGMDEGGQAIDVRDPMADRLRALARADDPVAALLSVEDIFDPALAARIAAPLRAIHADLLQHGARAMARRIAT